MKNGILIATILWLAILLAPVKRVEARAFTRSQIEILPLYASTPSFSFQQRFVLLAKPNSLYWHGSTGPLVAKSLLIQPSQRLEMLVSTLRSFVRGAQFGLHPTSNGILLSVRMDLEE